MIKFKATKEQLRNMFALAANASKPVEGVEGFYDPDAVFTEKDFKIRNYLGWRGISVRFLGSRMVKLSVEVTNVQKNVWVTYDLPPRPEFQSWWKKYPGFELIKACGGEVVTKRRVMAN